METFTDIIQRTKELKKMLRQLRKALKVRVIIKKYGVKTPFF